MQDTPNGFNSVEYQYDALDRRTSRKVNGQDETKYVYNKANQLTQIQYRNETTSYQYDAAGRLATKTLPGGIVQTYALDAASRLTQIQYKNGATLIDQLDLAYDPEGNITSKKLQNGSLKQDSALTASYDNANRMTSITVGGKTYTLSYDNNGNLTGKTNTADAVDTTSYTWDARNRLTAIAAPGTTASFNYDPLGRRIERTVNGTTTTYLYDSNQAIGEVRAGQTTSLLTGLSIDEAIARYASTGRLTQLTDQLGSVIRQIDASGAAQSSNAYSPYGEATTTGDDQGNSTEYTARENDETGLYFYRARYFDPVLKRWISEDPIGSVGGINLYEYVGGNPLIYVDPEGESLRGIIQILGILSGLLGNPSEAPDPLKVPHPTPNQPGEAAGQELPDPEMSTKKPNLPGERVPMPAPPPGPGRSGLPGCFRPPIPILLCPACPFVLPGPTGDPYGA